MSNNLYNMLHILTRLNQIAWKEPGQQYISYTKKIDLQTNSVLDVPEGVNLPRLTESFHKFRARSR